MHDRTIQPVVALLAGLLIRVLRRSLNYIVASDPIFIGLVGLFPGRR